MNRTFFTQCLSMFSLTQVVTLEQPELEERHHDLVTSIATDQKQLLDIEDQLLRLLNDAGSGLEVLDDEVRPDRQKHSRFEFNQRECPFPSRRHIDHM